jgi:hypothetical protein
MEQVAKQRPALCRSAANRSSNSPPGFSHFIAARFFRPLASNRTRFRANVEHERAGLVVNFEA